MPQVFLGIGSNIDPERHLRAAVRALATRFGSLRLSPVYASAAVGFEGAEFLNMVVALEAAEPPQGLAAILKQIEREQGGSRPLDIDFLLYGDLVLETPTLTLPRDDIRRYAFVLRPLAELAPGERHPLTGERYADLWAAFPAHTQPLRQVEIELL
jgi:2-amino-4-hydroxy-6-hydroxymethyldihydropteridine diphosphokinase